MPAWLFALGVFAAALNLFVAIVSAKQKRYVRAVWHVLVLAMLVAVMTNKL